MGLDTAEHVKCGDKPRGEWLGDRGSDLNQRGQ